MRNIGKKKFTARLHWLDYGPRRYDPATTFWTSPDPFSAARPDISPYAYCAANPAANIDPSGMIIVYPNDPDDISFNMNLKSISKYLGDLYTAPINLLKESKIVFEFKNSYKTRIINRVRPIVENSAEKLMKVEIHLDLDHCILLDNGEIMSTSMATLHEIGHAVAINESLNDYLMNLNTTDEQYDNLEERRNIEKFERPAARILGEPLRYDHGNYELIDNNGDVEYHKINIK